MTSHPRKVSLSIARAAARLACCVFVVGACAPRAAAAEPPAPKALLAEPEHDAGVVAPGESAVAKFRIENHGDAPLTLTAGNPVPYMAGVHTKIDGAPVPPGKAATVTLSLDTGALAGVGTVRVPLTTNDPATAKLTVAMTVEVKPALVADPGYARYNVVQKERDGTIKQTIWAVDGAKFRVVSVQSPMPALHLTFREAKPEERRADAGSQWHVESTLPADAPVGALLGDIVVVTDHPKQKKLHIPLSGFVRPVFAVTPPVADIGAVDGSKPFRFTLDVKNFASETIALERAESDLPGATVEIVPVTAGRAYKVHVAMPAGLPAGALSGTVRLFTASAKVPQIEVPVRGRLLEASAPADGK